MKVHSIRKALIGLCILFAVLIPKELHTEYIHRTIQYPHLLEKERACVEAGLFHEARGESPEGIRAVLEVLENRKNHRDFPDTFCGVILQPSQFSFVKEKKNPLKTPYKAHERDKEHLIKALAFEAVYGPLKKSQRVLGSPRVLYFTTTKIRPKWTHRMRIHATLGNHRFYESAS